MHTKIIAGVVLATCLGLSTVPQGTRSPMVATYGSLADAILAIKRTEADFVRSMLDGHFHAANAYVMRGDGQRAAAEMALFANEGDNAIGGVRKRLLEGGHHHNAAGEAKGIYEPGYVIITRQAKEQGLALSAEMRQAATEGEREEIWKRFQALAEPLIK